MLLAPDLSLDPGRADEGDGVKFEGAMALF
jgi:hypothetical protein